MIGEKDQKQDSQIDYVIIIPITMAVVFVVLLVGICLYLCWLRKSKKSAFSNSDEWNDNKHIWFPDNLYIGSVIGSSHDVECGERIGKHFGCDNRGGSNF